MRKITSFKLQLWSKARLPEPRDMQSKNKVKLNNYLPLKTTVFWESVCRERSGQAIYREDPESMLGLVLSVIVKVGDCVEKLNSLKHGKKMDHNWIIGENYGLL